VARGDDELVARLRAGDETVFAALVERYHPRLVRFAVTFVHEWNAAEDVVQDTWVALLRGLDGFEGRSTLQAWLFGICANRARSAFLRQVRTVPVDTAGPTVDPARFGPDRTWSDPPDSWDDVDARLDAAKLAPLVLAAIEQLPAAQRQVVTLRDVEGLTGNEVCRILDISDANQRVLLHRGRARVRQALENDMREVP